jgi:hypothetical protein
MAILLQRLIGQKSREMAPEKGRFLKKKRWEFGDWRTDFALLLFPISYPACGAKSECLSPTFSRWKKSSGVVTRIRGIRNAGRKPTYAPRTRATGLGVLAAAFTSRVPGAAHELTPGAAHKLSESSSVLVGVF